MVLAYHLNTFSSKEQTKFLVDYWKEKQKEKSNNLDNKCLLHKARSFVSQNASIYMECVKLKETEESSNACNVHVPVHVD